MRKPFLGGNWKMNTDSKSAVELAKGVAEKCASLLGKCDVAVCPPFVYLPAVKSALGSSAVGLGAQDVYFEAKGAFTGEVSTAMLKDVGCKYVLIGHSERRHVLKESNELINKKLIAAIDAGLLPIFCVGELLEERNANKTEAVVKEQIEKGMSGISADKAKGFIEETDGAEHFRSPRWLYIPGSPSIGRFEYETIIPDHPSYVRIHELNCKKQLVCTGIQ